jgi:putative ABC transport system permease protein
LTLSPADQAADARKDRSLYLFGRLKAGVTLEQARARFVTLAERAAEDFPEVEKGWGAAARTLPDFVIYTFGIRNGLSIMMTTVGFVLMIACANVAGLLLARAAGRRKESAIRISLGAGRFRIVRQLLTEGLLIAVLGGTTGLLLSYGGIKFIQARMAFNEYILAIPITLDRNVLFFWRCYLSVFGRALQLGACVESVANRREYQPEGRESFDVRGVVRKLAFAPSWWPAKRLSH